jgi:hypothetical protein
VVGVKGMRAQRRSKQAKMPVVHLHIVRYLTKKPTVKSWKGLEYDWAFWIVFVEWCSAQE